MCSCQHSTQSTYATLPAYSACHTYSACPMRGHCMNRNLHTYNLLGRLACFKFFHPLARGLQYCQHHQKKAWFAVLGRCAAAASGPERHPHQPLPALDLRGGGRRPVRAHLRLPQHEGGHGDDRSQVFNVRCEVRTVHTVYCCCCSWGALAINCHPCACTGCLRPDAEGADAEGDVSMASVAPKATFKALRKPVRG